MNIDTCTGLFIAGICRTGQFAHIFGRILLIIFFEFLNFYRTTRVTMQNVVSRIISIPRDKTGQGFDLVWPVFIAWSIFGAHDAGKNGRSRSGKCKREWV